MVGIAIKEMKNKKSIREIWMESRVDKKWGERDEQKFNSPI